MPDTYCINGVEYEYPEEQTEETEQACLRAIKLSTEESYLNIYPQGDQSPLDVTPDMK